MPPTWTAAERTLLSECKYMTNQQAANVFKRNAKRDPDIHPRTATAIRSYRHVSRRHKRQYRTAQKDRSIPMEDNTPPFSEILTIIVLLLLIAISVHEPAEEPTPPLCGRKLIAP